MIDLNKFYKFEVGIGVERTMSDVVFLAYALAPNGEKILRKSRSIALGQSGETDVAKSAIHELMITLFHAMAHEWDKEMEIEQSKQE